MSSGKKSTARKVSSGDSYISEVLSDEINQVMSSEQSDFNVADDLFELLKKEALEEKKDPEVKTKKMVYEDKTTVLDSDSPPEGLENVSHLPPPEQVFSNKRNPVIDLKNADYIKFAQNKVKSLEKEVEELRGEAEELALAGTHFKTLAEERDLKVKSLEVKLSELQDSSVEERKILNEAIQARESKIEVLQDRVEQLESELDSRYNRLRMRERELESRLEILKQEQEAVAYSKDQMILKLKKQNNILNADLEKQRAHQQKTTSRLQEKEEALRRTVKALKLSLTMLESQNKN